MRPYPKIGEVLTGTWIKESIQWMKEAQELLENVKKTNIKIFTQRQQILIKMGCTSKIKHFSKEETKKLTGVVKAVEVVQEYQDIITKLTRT